MGRDGQMNLKRFHALIEVADRRSFSDAALRLSLTQPAISKQIKALEQDLGVTLFRRDLAQIELTEAGALAYRAGKRLLQEWDALLEASKDFQQHLTGRLRIGASTIPGAYLLPDAIRTFREIHPHVDLEIDVQSSGEIVDLLLHGQVDVALVGMDPRSDAVCAELICNDELVLIAPAHYEGCPEVEDLHELPLIGRKTMSGTQQAIEQVLLGEFGLKPSELHYVAHVMDTATLLAMVESGVGCGFVSSLACARAQVKELMRFQTKRAFYFTALCTRQSEPLIGSLRSLFVRREGREEGKNAISEHAKHPHGAPGN